MLVGKFRFDSILEPLKRPFITAEKFTMYRIVCDVQWEGFDIGNVDERSMVVLEIAGQKTPFFEPFPLGQFIRKLDSQIDI